MKTNPFGYSVKKSPSGGYTVISLSYTPPDKKGKSQMIKIAPELGSNLFSWRWDGHEIMYHEPNLLKHCGFTGNFVLFPTPNRVRNSTYLWKGKRSIMKKRGKIIELHGLVFDESWKHTAPVIKKDCVCLQTSIRITRQSALFNAFPFPCALTLEYRVYSNRIRISYTVKNQGATALPFGFGLHPYFSRLSGNDKTFITIPAESWMESPSETLLPTGKLISVAGKSYDVRTATPVGKLSLDHVYTNLAPSRFATIEYRTLGFKVLLKPSRDFTHMVVYTGHKNAVCIENQTCSTDAHNLWDKKLRKESHLIVTPTGQSHTGHVDYVVAL